jgi:hypothetical protein
VSTTTANVRRLVACLASMAIGVRLYLVIPITEAHHAREVLFGGATIAVPFVVAALVWTNRLTAQLLARGAWWSMLLLGMLGAMTGRRDAGFGVFIASCSAGALLAAGGAGLASRGRFAPVAFRGTLLISLVLAIADTGAITWFGIGEATFDHKYWVPCIAVPMIVGVIGLVRLRTWGLIVNALTNAAIIVLVGKRIVALPSPLRELFMVSATVQLLIPIPMLASILRGRAPNPDAWRRTKAIAPIAIILAIVGLSIYAAYACHGRLVDA